MSHVIRDVPTQIMVCDGCGEDIPKNAVDGLHYLTLVVKVRIKPDKTDLSWVRETDPTARFRKEQEQGTTKILHMHLGEAGTYCKIKGKDFRTVVDAALKPER